MNDVEQYIYNQDPSIQPVLQKIRKVILDVHPNITEKISYGMPTFVYHKNIFHFAAQKRHIGLYPSTKPIEFFQHQLTNYKTSKGAIQVPYGVEMPFELIRMIIEFQITQMNELKK